MLVRQLDCQFGSAVIVTTVPLNWHFNSVTHTNKESTLVACFFVANQTSSI
jgi:hypothetical protein